MYASYQGSFCLDKLDPSPIAALCVHQDESPRFEHPHIEAVTALSFEVDCARAACLQQYSSLLDVGDAAIMRCFAAALLVTPAVTLVAPIARAPSQCMSSSAALDVPGAFVVTPYVGMHAIDATPARRRGVTNR